MLDHTCLNQGDGTMGIQRTREPEGREIIMRRALLLQLAEGIRMLAAMVLKCKIIIIIIIIKLLNV